MKKLLNTAIILCFTIACDSGDTGARKSPTLVSEPESGGGEELNARQMPNEQLNPRSDATDSSGVTAPKASKETSGKQAPDTGGATESSTSSSGGSSGSTTGSKLPDVISNIPLPDMPCSIGQACASQADLIKHCVKQIIIPSC